jgi:carbamoyl-phosphate synthase large subunit
MNILFTCAGRRNYLINYFKYALKGRGKVYATDMQFTAPAMVDADKAFLVSSIYDPDYIDSLIRIISENQVNAVISLNDLELPILAANREKFEHAGAKLLVSATETIEMCFDKWKTASFLEKAGIKTPLTFISKEESLLALKQGTISYPLVIKPRWGSASIAIDFSKDGLELDLAYQLQILRIGRTILSQVSSVDPARSILIQEFIAGTEYGMDVLNDFEGNYIGTFVRKKILMRTGETDKAVSVVDDRFEALGRKISKLIRHMGNMDCDVIEHQDELYVLEMNPRFGGGYPFSHEAGVDTPSIYIELLNGGRNIEQYLNYKPDVMFSKCDRLIRLS